MIKLIKQFIRKVKRALYNIIKHEIILEIQLERALYENWRDYNIKLTDLWKSLGIKQFSGWRRVEHAGLTWTEALEQWKQTEGAKVDQYLEQQKIWYAERDANAVQIKEWFARQP